MLLPLGVLHAQVPTVEKGVIDLRGQSLDKPIELNGDWRFIWNRLIDPATISREKSEDYMCVPCLWKKETSPENMELTAMGYATYHLTILLSENEMNVGIIIPDTYMSSRLFLNGEEIGSVGTPATSKQSYSMGWAEKAYVLHSHSGELEVVLQIANFHHSKGGFAQPILFGTDQAILAYNTRQTMIDLFLTGSLFMGGLFFLGLFYFGRNERPVLYFSLFCFTYGYRILGAGNYQLQEYFPDMPFQLTYILEYSSLFISAYLFARYTRFLYPTETSKWLADGFGVISALLLGTAIFAPISISSLTIEPYFILLLFGFVYVLIVYTKAVFARRSGAYFSLISTAKIGRA
ncbi:MAG: 7TM-DISM domain-containing protein, partial [Bacteroidota bacterium]